MSLEHYKAASERTDADERALVPAFKRKTAPNKAQHSPLPWSVQNGAIYDASDNGRVQNVRLCKLVASSTAIEPADAELIVRAVNNYSNAIQALRDLTKEIKLGTLNVRKDFSLMVAHAAATKVLHESEVQP